MLEGLKRLKEFKHMYEFSVKEAVEEYSEDEYLDEEGDGSATLSWPSWEVRFTNLSDVNLFVTILNLTPGWGVHQTFPFPFP